MIFFINACSSVKSSLYNFDYKLTDKSISSQETNLNIQIPTGWFVAEDNTNNAKDIWLVKDDYSATIKFFVLNNTADNEKESNEFVSKNLLEINKALVKSQLTNKFSGFKNEENFDYGGRKFYSYEYNDENNKPVRTVVFQYLAVFYEVKAYALNSPNPQEIFSVQNSILASIK